MRIARVKFTPKELEILKKLDKKCFPWDDPYNFERPKNQVFWLVWEGEQPIAYGGMKPWRGKPHVYFLSRVGVLHEFRGKGIQKKLIRKRVQYLRQNGFSRCITYTAVDNYPSSNSLIREGFRTYYWGEMEDSKKNIIWWEKKL